jgi:hypothetical protein
MELGQAATDPLDVVGCHGASLEPRGKRVGLLVAAHPHRVLQRPSVAG